ncbi:LytTR family DNA-binding domain-containing protein [Macrococcus armenti]|uniref:LytTR family DNA-binding domain-containing protein n=1 Tax=Macrococcus armenti TaxID=2875764 RepID=UPI001CCB88D7|nr:LytTR family transcriptional regulator DNA-binding domain-containing protein [Macrococcus armenti]UBH15453.1 LytTR family transcriptional regulator DNA-binding domain-containing protein [Macrococcus armenti]UBH17813.1 LytTR family transcriptional regulator DNA-binding domain-containing protein [Macrococcus armenti]UBH20078.1 LytTR family transcriptional regulator DNA-binding domain-containing protein [Macrococcus armenti]
MTELLNHLQSLDFKNHACIVSNMNQQKEIIAYFNKKDIWIETFNTPFHERLTVKEQLKFYMKWYGATYNIDDVLQSLKLHEYSKVKVKKLEYDEYVLLKIALAYVQDNKFIIFKDLLHNLKVETVDIILNVLPQFDTEHKVLHILSYLDHALLLSNEIYQVKKSQLKRLEVYEDRELLNERTEISKKAEQSTQVSTNNDELDSMKNECIPENISREIHSNLSRSNVFRITVKTEDKTLFINPEDINYIEGAEGKVNIHFNGESFKADYTLNELEEKLKVYGFYRCHRSYIINLQKVTEMITWSKNSYSIKVDSMENTFIPLSRNKVKEIQGYFNSHMVQFKEN